MMGLIDTMTVYTEHATTGQYTVVAATAVPCRLAHIKGGTASAPARTELAALRRLLWGPATIISERSQIDVGGTRYNVVAGTMAAYRGPAGTMHHRSCDVVRALDG